MRVFMLTWRLFSGSTLYVWSLSHTGFNMSRNIVKL